MSAREPFPSLRRPGTGGRRPLTAGRASGRGARGQALIEFALVLPLFALLVFALLDLGRVIYAQHTLAQAAREAARTAVVSPEDAQPKFNAIRAAALATAPGVELAGTQIVGAAGSCSAVSTSPAFTVDDATSPATCFYPDGLESGARVVVNIAAQVELVTPIVSNVLGGSHPVSAQSIMFLP